MQHTDLSPYTQWIWIATGIVWLAGALASKPSVSRQSARSRLVHIAILAPGFCLLFTNRLAVGPLAWRFLPAWPAIAGPDWS